MAGYGCSVWRAPPAADPCTAALRVAPCDAYRPALVRCAMGRRGLMTELAPGSRPTDRRSTVIAMSAQNCLICVCGERRAEGSLAAAAMRWSLKPKCHRRELGRSLGVRGGAEVANQAQSEGGARTGGGPAGPLSGRVAIVTGAAGGLGAATLRALRHAGATVVPVDLHGDDCLIADVATAEGNRRMVDLALERHGRLDILVLNAGAQAMN